MKKKKNKCRFEFKLATFISIICMILGISNLWLNNETIKFIIWPILLVAMLLNFLGEFNECQKWVSRWFVKTSECIDWCWCVTMIEYRIRRIELPEEERQAILDFIEEQEEIVHANRTQRLKEHRLDEDDA